MGISDWFSLEWQVFTPELVILLFALLAPIVATWDNDRRGMQQFAATGLAGAFLLTLGSVLQIQQSSLFGIDGFNFNLDYIGTSAQPDFALGTHFMVTEASQIFKLVFLGVALLAVIGVGRPLKGGAREDYGEFFALLLFATLGMMVVASARDLIVLFLGIETASLSSYLLAGFRRDHAGAEASLKYFIIGAIASGLTLFAISLIYGMAGTTHIPDLAASITTAGGFDAASAIAIVFLLAGLGFKISSVPIHTWAPDVYYGAPTPVVAVLATASKMMGFVAVFNVFLVGLLGVADNWELAVAVIAAVTMTVGNLAALRQESMRRMLAYSSIAQAGYVLIAVAVVGAVGGLAAGGGAAGTSDWALGGGIFHLMVNAAMKLGAFLIVGALLFLGLGDRIEGWKGLGRKAPFFAFAMTIFMLSMAGLPPLGGFASKFVLFGGAVKAGIAQGMGWLVWLAVIAVVNSAISLFYYLRVIRTMYVEESPDTERMRLPNGVTVAVFVCLVAVIVMGIWAQPFVDASVQAAHDLMSASVAP